MLFIAYLSFHYADTRPTVMQEQAGRVYLLNVHGRIVYLTTAEHSTLAVLEGLAITSIGSFGVIVFKLTRAKR